MDFSPDPLCIKGTKLAGLQCVVARGVRAFISNSSAITHALRRVHPALTNVRTIFCAVDVNLFKAEEDSLRRLTLRDRLGLPRRAKIAITCGAVIRRKGIDFLLDCWQEITKRYTGDSLFVIVGPYNDLKECEGSSNEYAESIVRRVASEPLKGRVVLTGTSDTIHDYLKASDLFLFAGRQEGSPNTIREAMACSLPIVSLNLPNVTEDMIDNNKSGIIVYPADYENVENWQTEPIKGERVREDFVDAALLLMNDPKLAAEMGSLARKKAESLFSFDIKADAYKELFEKA